MDTSDPFVDILIQDKDGYDVLYFYGTTSGITTDQVNDITIASLSQNVFLPSQPTDYTIKFTPFNPIPTTGAIVIEWPAQITVPEDGIGCIITVSIGDLDGIEENYCSFDRTTRTVTITGVYGDGESEEVTVKLLDIINPADNFQNEGFIVRTYSDVDATKIIDKSIADLLIPRLDCDYPCKTCVGSEDPIERTTCTSCWTHSNAEFKYFMMDFDENDEELDYGTCKAQCPPGYSRDGRDDYICEKCAIYCDQCKEMDRDFCITCHETFPFMVENSGVCLERCIDGYYQSSDRTCNRCEAPCKDCEGTANTCLSCLEDSDTKFFDKSSNTCISECPFDFTPIKNVCEECDSPCLTCFGATDVCRSCDGY